MNIQYRFIGWCRDELKNADKVWGAIAISNNKCITFWGRRGKALQTKVVNDDWDLDRLINKKRDKGYRSVDQQHLERVYPEFQSDLERTAVWGMLRA